MDSAAGVEGHRNVAGDRVDLIEVPDIRAGSAIIRAHGNDWQALSLLTANSELRGLYARFGAAQIGSAPQCLFRCCFARDSGEWVVSQRITQFEFLIDGQPDDPGKRQFVLFELIGCVPQSLFGGLPLHLRPDRVDLGRDFILDPIGRLLV